MCIGILWAFAGACALATAPAAAVTLVITADDLCEISIDGDAPWALPSRGTRKVDLPEGEHVLETTCGGKRSRQIVTLAGGQKVVVVGSAPAAPATTAAPSAPVPALPSFDTSSLFGQQRRRTKPSGLADLDGLWMVEIRKKQKVYTCPVAVSASMSSTPLGLASATTSECIVMESHVDSRGMTLDLAFGDPTAVTTADTSLFTGRTTYSPTGNFVPKEQQRFTLQLVDDELRGERGGWTLTMKPEYADGTKGR